MDISTKEIACTTIILGLILDSFRLKDYFKESAFSTAGIMFVVGIFSALFSLIGAFFIWVLKQP
ncbi:MAG: hypothetical protein QXQ46_07800 [Thermoplasmatales archaeon]